MGTGEIQKKWAFEVIFWIVALLVVALILLPLYIKGIPFPFYMFNIAFILIFVTFTRYIFFLRYMPFSHFTPLKMVFIFAAIPLMLFLIEGLTLFQAYNDEVGLQELVQALSLDEQTSMMKYIRTEYLFFGVSGMICTILLPFRMIISIWRVINKGTV